MFFMILFPIAILSRLRLIWVAIGISIHIGIAFMMGLITFSMIMIGLELALISDKEYELIFRKISEFKLISLKK